MSANAGAVISVLVFDGDGALVMGRTFSSVGTYRPVGGQGWSRALAGRQGAGPDASHRGNAPR